MTGLERVDWNGGIANVAVWEVRGQKYSCINFAIFADLYVATSPSAKIKLAKFVVCGMLYTCPCTRCIFLTYAPYTGNLTETAQYNNIMYMVLLA